jgi:hypothetical protein
MYKKKKVPEVVVRKKRIPPQKPGQETVHLSTSEEQYTTVPVRKTEQTRDKIFGNNYNTGNIETEHFTEMKIEKEFSENMGDYFNADDYMEHMKLMNEVVEVFNKSQWKELPLTKKFSKDMMPYIFTDLFSSLHEKNFATIDVFISIAEFMDISYERVYEIANLKAKELLIKELEIKYKVLSDRKINRLF